MKILAIDTHFEAASPLPMVTVAGHTTLPGVSNVLLDEKYGAKLSLKHLRDPGRINGAASLPSKSSHATEDIGMLNS